MAFKHVIFWACFLIIKASAWEALPNIPTGRRSQFLVLNENGAYKYGYDTGDGHAGKQAGDVNNQVEGHYFYKTANGENVDLKYTAGVQGFVPENLDQLLTRSGSGAATKTNIASNGYSFKDLSQNNVYDDQANTGDSSYSFGFDTDTYKRKESADAQGNVKGHYSYVNEAGTHDLSYIAGSNTGFVATSGSLSKTNGISGAEYAKSSPYSQTPIPFGKINSDGSYSYSYNAGDHSHSQSGDANGNVQGSYSYNNEQGQNDLQYIANAESGFKIVGGNLLTNSRSNTPAGVSPYNYAGTNNYNSPIVSNDGSYSFSYNTGDSSRQESADASGNVQGKYSYSNNAGNHDLSYVAGSATGFQVTGGSLAQPTSDLLRSQPVSTVSAYNTAADSSNLSPDGSYSFNYNTGDSSRQENSDSQGNIQGRYSYRNNAGNHDLSYVAGSSTGFVVTGGSLAQPTDASSKSFNGALHSDSNSDSSTNIQPDGSYSFSYNAGDSSRQETADSNGNVQGSYAYRNNAGNHDLSYVAGAETGFQVTGGSLAEPTNAVLKSSDSNYDDGVVTDAQSDGSYSFGYNTADSSRQENSDAQGNVQGSYSYHDDSGSHDLSYVAGAKSGFKVTGGNLAQPTNVENEDSTTYTTNNDGETPSTDDQADTGDSSYSFTIDTDEYKRVENADANGNVVGSFSYKNSAGNHDLSYKAGSSSGFVATGGSLSDPNVIAAKIATLPYTKQYNAPSGENVVTTYSAGNNDASYSFSINTKDYQRQETSDASGNVKGAYSYQNSAGNHDLSFVAGSATGFLPTGGNLKTPLGVNDQQQTILNDFQKTYSSSNAINLPSTKISYSVGSASVKTYLPPKNDKGKFGYIYDTKF